MNINFLRKSPPNKNSNNNMTSSSSISPTDSLQSFFSCSNQIVNNDQQTINNISNNNSENNHCQNNDTQQQLQKKQSEHNTNVNLELFKKQQSEKQYQDNFALPMSKCDQSNCTNDETITSFHDVPQRSQNNITSKVNSHSDNFNNYGDENSNNHTIIMNFPDSCMMTTLKMNENEQLIRQNTRRISSHQLSQESVSITVSQQSSSQSLLQNITQQQQQQSVASLQLYDLQQLKQSTTSSTGNLQSPPGEEQNFLREKLKEREAEVKGLIGQLSILKSSKHELVEESHANAELTSMLRSRVDSLSIELQSKDAIIVKLESDVAMLMQHLQSETARLTNEITECKLTTIELQASNELLITQMHANQQSQQNHMHPQQIDFFEQQQQQHERQLQQLQEEQQQQKEFEQQQHQEQLEQQRQLNMQQQEDIEQLRTTIEEKNQQLFHTLNELQDLLKDNSALQEKYHDIWQQFNDKCAEITAISSENAFLRLNIEEQTQNMYTRRDVISQLRIAESTIKEITASNANLLREGEQWKLKCAQLVQEMNELQRYISEVQFQVQWNNKDQLDNSNNPNESNHHQSMLENSQLTAQYENNNNNNLHHRQQLHRQIRTSRCNQPRTSEDISATAGLTTNISELAITPIGRSSEGITGNITTTNSILIDQNMRGCLDSNLKGLLLHSAISDVGKNSNNVSDLLNEIHDYEQLKEYIVSSRPTILPNNTTGTATSSLQSHRNTSIDNQPLKQQYLLQEHNQQQQEQQAQQQQFLNEQRSQNYALYDHQYSNNNSALFSQQHVSINIDSTYNQSQLCTSSNTQNLASISAAEALLCHNNNNTTRRSSADNRMSIPSGKYSNMAVKNSLKQSIPVRRHSYVTQQDGQNESYSMIEESSEQQFDVLQSISKSAMNKSQQITGGMSKVSARRDNSTRNSLTSSNQLLKTINSEKQFAKQQQLHQQSNVQNGQKYSQGIISKLEAKHVQSVDLTQDTENMYEYMQMSHGQEKSKQNKTQVGLGGGDFSQKDDIESSDMAELRKKYQQSVQMMLKSENKCKVSSKRTPPPSTLTPFQVPQHFAR